MKVSDLAQGRVFLISILAGILCVVLFDFFAIIRKRCGKNVIIINLFDAVYFLLAFLLIFYTGVKFNFGAFRYYQLLGLMIGFSLQYLLFSNLERKLFDKILSLFLKLIKILVKLIYKPTVFILRIIVSLGCFFEEKTVKLILSTNKTLKKLSLKREKNKKTVKKRIKMI